MKYCNSCILPDTRPNLVIDDSGSCNACKNYDWVKPNISWDKRKKAFQKVADYAKSRSHGYDCVIPVSGGKDSHWQVIKCLEYGLNELKLQRIVVNMAKDNIASERVAQKLGMIKIGEFNNSKNENKRTSIYLVDKSMM